MISFIITARDEAPDVLNATVIGLARTTSRARREVIVVDDGSLVPISPQAADLVVRNSAPRGVSPSRRIGAAAARGDVLVWLDAHMSFSDGWLEAMLPHAENGALLCSAFWDYTLTIGHCWGADYVWCGQRDYHQQQYPGFGLRHRVQRPDADAADVPMIIGACYMLARPVYRQLGGFSPFFRTWGVDEQDLCLRAHVMGVPVRCIPAARVGHLSRSAFPYPVQFEHLEYNQLVMIRTVFEDQTIQRLERFFMPLPDVIRHWVEEVDLRAWRSEVQARRVHSDQEVLRRLGIE